MLRDVRQSLRGFRRRPGFICASIAVLALGVAANTAVFTLVNALMLRPVPFAEPDRLVLISGSQPGRNELQGPLSYPFFAQVVENNRSLTGAAVCVFETFNLSGRGDPEQVDSARVSWNFFSLLGVRPAAGRTFTPEEDRPGADPVVMVSHELATRLFTDATRAAGASLTLDGRSHTIVGVLPPRFAFPLLGGRREIWATRVFDMNFVTPARVARGGTYFRVIGRLGSAAVAQARAELNLLYQRYRAAQPGNFDSTLNLAIEVDNLQQQVVAGVRPTLWILSAAVGFVILIACANVAALLLSRALGRRKEFAVRAALGASRAVLLRHLLAESACLAAVGGAIGTVLGHSAAQWLTALNPEILTTADLSFDSRMLAFALGLCAVTAVLAGMAPALELSRTGAVLLEESRGTTGSRHSHYSRNALMVVQVALSMTLLTGSGLLVQSFLRLRSTPPGFDASGILTMHLMLPPARYARPAQLNAFYREVLDRLGTIPGVEAAAISTALPVYPTHLSPALFEGQPAVPLGQRPIVNLQQITPAYARVMRIPVLSGRTFDDHDDAAAPKVAMVNRTAARRFWPSENPIGKRFWLGNLPDPYRIAGVLADTRNNGLALAVQPEVLLPLPQMTSPYIELNLRTRSDPGRFTQAARSAIAAVDRDQPVTQVRSMEEFLFTQSAQPRFMMLLLGGFSVAACFLAVVGIYGVVSFSVAGRRRELGIRIALGAGARDVLLLTAGQAAKLAIAGIAIGAAGSLALAHFLASLLYQTSPADPAAVTGSALLFAGVSLVAAWLPARRALRIDPAESLHAE